VRAQPHQVAVDALQLGEQHPDPLDAIRHLRRTILENPAHSPNRRRATFARQPRGGSDCRARKR
jgi:hypothetical protein